MNNSWTHYPKVHALGKRDVLDILQGTVTIQEKVDGSQFSFGVFGGMIRVRSRGQEFPIEKADKCFKPAIETVIELAANERLVPCWTYRGEAFARPKHNVLAYGRVPQGNIMLYDIATDRETYMDAESVRQEAFTLGLEATPILYEGPGDAVTHTMLENFLDLDSILLGQKLEGVVIKNYSLRDLHGKPLMAKLVRPEFKEKMQGRVKAPKIGEVATIVATYRTEARWHKAVQHLRERGELKEAPEDIGPLIKEVCTDLLEEEGEAIKEVLFKQLWKKISKGVGAGLAEWYKDQLVKGQFNQGEKND